MGSKSGYIIAALFLLTISAPAQERPGFTYFDSVTYAAYIRGEWEKVITFGEEAVKMGIDYKYLRQRLGVAYFSGDNNIKAISHFRKAMESDSHDQFTLKYLYYSYNNEGKEDAAAIIAKKMGRILRDSLDISIFKPVESIDAEFNFRYAASSLRSNPLYYNAGVSSRFGGRLSLYQMISGFYQTITVRYPYRDVYIEDKQIEYYALVRYSLSQSVSLRAAYHHLNTSYSINSSTGDLGYIGLEFSPGRLYSGLEASMLYFNNEYTRQYGITAGLTSLGRSKLYFKGSLSLVDDNDESRYIYLQKVGLRAGKRIWLEGNVLLGNLNNYSDYKAMYLHNSIDATTFRTGGTIYAYPGRRISLWFSFAFEKKQYYEDNNYYYNQFSYLGGIRWKL